MNNRNNWEQMKNIKAPDELKERTLAAARQARRAEQQAEPQQAARTPRRLGTAKRILAAACAFAVVVGGTAVWQSRTSGQPAADAVAEVVAHSFGIVAYAADTGEEILPKDSRIVFDNAAGKNSSDNGFFSGCLFRVTGDSIATVSASIDKGGLYRDKTLRELDYEEYCNMAEAEAATDPRLAGADEVMWYGRGETDNLSEMVWYADVCWKLKNGFTEGYDPEASYGFWAEPQPFDQTVDVRQAWHDRIDEFDGAKLTVTVTFTDGTTDTQTLILHTGKLGCEYVDGESGPQLTGEVLTDEQAETQAYVYGVYAEIA